MIAFLQQFFSGYRSIKSYRNRLGFANLIESSLPRFYGPPYTLMHVSVHNLHYTLAYIDVKKYINEENAFHHAKRCHLLYFILFDFCCCRLFDEGDMRQRNHPPL